MTTYLKRHIPCPDQINCGSSDAYCIIQDDQGTHGFCYSCRKKFDVDSDQDQEADYKPDTKPFLKTEPIKDGWRSISSKTLERFGVKKAEGKNWLVQPYMPYGQNITTAQKVRAGRTPEGRKKMFWRGHSGNVGLFGHHLFPPGGKIVTVTTGEGDAMAVYEMMGDFPVVSLVNGDGSVKNLTTEDYDYLNSFSEIRVCFDNDESGREARDKFVNLFPAKNKVVEFPAEFVDAHQMLEEGETKKFYDYWWKAQQFKPNNIVYPADIKDEVLNPPKYDIIPYPWDSLNAQIFGLHTPEVITVLAEPKVGKSFFTAMVAHHLWKTTEESVGDISVENTPDERARTLLSMYMEKPLHLTLAGEDIGVTKAEISVSFDEYFNDRRLVLFEKDGLHDPLEIIAKIDYFIEVLGCRFIIFDHINYLTSYHDSDERKTLDKLSNMLVDKAKDKRINMMIVSHVNDDGKTFGSRNLIKASHTVISLKRDRNNADENIRNTTILKVDESRRYGSRIGKEIYLKYNENNYSWTEIPQEVYDNWKNDSGDLDE